jgi:hypothetical protein
MVHVLSWTNVEFAEERASLKRHAIARAMVQRPIIHAMESA